MLHFDTIEENNTAEGQKSTIGSYNQSKIGKNNKKKVSIETPEDLEN
jgi:hypothetical protein